MAKAAPAKNKLGNVVIMDKKDIQYLLNKKIIVKDNKKEELSIPCRLCTKVFSNPMALRNHVRVLHMGEEVDVDEWLQDVPLPQPDSPKLSKAEQQALIKQRTETVISSMHAFDMTNLISSDVQFVVVKAEESEANAASRKRKVKKDKKTEQKRKAKPTERKKAITDPVAGPFECLQPSSVFSAGVCHQIFFSCCEYSAHFRDKHSKRQRRSRCQVCEKLLINEDGKVKEYACQVCGAEFGSRAELSQHTAVAHVKLKPYKCDQCKKGFANKANLRQHIRMHNGDRPFPCTFCAKAFTQKSGLQQHLRTHTKVKPYRCVICHKTFCQSINMKQHMRIHTNLAPFQCAICDKKFKQRTHLKNHLKIHNDSNMDDQKKLKQYPQIVEEVTEQVVIDEQEYILSDNGDETWTVMVDDGTGVQEEIVS